ncbi:hypothetical protein [Jannaschia sp. W003]|uniref:hypothetical protein n=1 Tax=Jannaschia sp. W003 TaxID=2867012 RepID=UPI0021A5B1FE|nr:hypothetical protein [Jannaschia sp. W003]UWQ23162.1 hypothetical protein K3554_16410 [Jannaschia sp. W003]
MALTPPYRRRRSRAAIGVACASILWVPGLVRADGVFFQVDAARSTLVGTASVGVGDLTFGAGVVDYEGGEAYRLSGTRRFDVLPTVATLKAGPSFGLVAEDGTDVDAEIGLRLVAERYVPVPFGGVFLLGEYDTIESAWFSLAQVSFAGPGVALEVSYGESDSYAETSVALAKRMGGRPFSLRLGYKFDADEAFAGFSLNTF